MDFQNKTVIVTGSGRGIGYVIAERFSRCGANVVVSDLDYGRAEAAAAEIGGNCFGIKANVTVWGDIVNLFKAAKDRFGTIDIVVNNAGIIRDAFIVRMDEKDWNIVLSVNLKGAFLATKLAGRIMMKQRSGRIINISSVVGIKGNIGQANYAASKAGLIGLTRSAAKELAEYGITVNAIAAGLIDTEMTTVLGDKIKSYFLNRVLIKRPGTPDDIAFAVLFFASDEASYVTGQVLAVDGGLSIA